MTDGVYTDISIEDYHANTTHVSATVIKYAKESLRHYRWYRDGKLPAVDSTAMQFGNAFELALLSPKEYLQKVSIIPEQEWFDAVLADNQNVKTIRNTTIYKNLYKNWLSLNQGKYHINETGPESFETIEEMLSSCYQDKTIQALIKNTEYQLSLFWTDPDTGVKLKTRPDICKRKKNVVVNLKTTLDGSPQAFSKDMNKYDYPLQAVIEMRGCLASGVMDKIDKYFWLVVEKLPPYNATIYEFQETDIAACSDNLDFLLNKISNAEKQNVWPGYSDQGNEFGIVMARIPLWYNF